MKIMVLGVRGIPDVQGGVETHVEHLYERIVQRGCDVEVLVRSPFIPKERKHHGKIHITRLWSPRQSGAEALLHSIVGVLYAAISRPDILHIHAIGPALVVPLARAFGLRVVVTHHGPDYDRDKWGPFAKLVLRIGERLGMRHSHARIVISRVISDLVMDKYQRPSHLIPNGVIPHTVPAETDHLARFGLEPGRYFLQVSRMVPEKRQLDLIAAYAAASLPGWKLALVGRVDSDDYCKRVRAASDAAGVILTGFLNGEALRQLYGHAGGFILPSSHEGLPIAMLEALSYGVPVLASNIAANLEVGLEKECYFPLGDSRALATRLERLARDPPTEAERIALRRWTIEKYDWDRIASQTMDVYENVRRAPSSP